MGGMKCVCLDDACSHFTPHIHPHTISLQRCCERKLVLVFIFTLNWTHFSIRNEHFHFLNYACWWHSISSPTLRLFPLLSICFFVRFFASMWRSKAMRDWRSLSILGVTFDITFHSTLNVLAVESVNESLTKDRGNISAALTEAVDKLSLLIHPENFPTATMTFQMGCELAYIKFTVCDWLDLQPANSRKYFN